MCKLPKFVRSLFEKISFLEGLFDKRPAISESLQIVGPP